MFINYEPKEVTPLPQVLTVTEKKNIVDTYCTVSNKRMSYYMKKMFPNKINEARSFAKLVYGIDNTIKDLMPYTTQPNLLTELTKKFKGVDVTVLTYIGQKAVAYSDGTGTCTWTKFKTLFKTTIDENKQS